MNLLKAQRQVAKDNFDKIIFLDGLAGTGKTTAGIERVKQLIRDGVAPDSILVIVPQMALGVPYVEALRRSRVEIGADIQATTIGKLAFETVELFYPLLFGDLEEQKSIQRPHFLTLELVQYYMTRFVAPEIEHLDLFNSVTISRSRLYTQIVDNLNKSALVGFDYTTLAERLKSAWRGDVAQQHIYDDAQTSAQIFREICLKYFMLDFSLQLEFFKMLWDEHAVVRQYYTQQYRHLIVDNIEEDTPTTHDLLRDWIPHTDSTLLIYDQDAGYRRFLGADPLHASRLRDLCSVHITLDNHRVMSDVMSAFQDEIARSLGQVVPERKDIVDPRDAIIYEDNRYHPQMIDWATENIASLIHNQGVSPQEIVILAPFMPDALRYSLMVRLQERDVPVRSHRPSRALRDEPATRALLTWAKIAHPDWDMQPGQFDLAYALTTSIDGLDLVRARLLADVLYRKGALQPFATIQNETVQHRITFDLGQRYDRLYQWLVDYQAEEQRIPLDVFFTRFFGEVLSQPTFGFHEQWDAANATANLIDSARQFRQMVSEIEPARQQLAREYVQMVDAGVIANQYVRDWVSDQDAVLIAPAYTFLLSNQPVDYQFWLNVGSVGWAQRLYQPLTHPYVLSRQWPLGQVWTDIDEHETNQETLSFLVLGLIRRCRKQIYLGLSEFGEQGYEQRGPLLMAIQSMLRRLRREEQAHV
ncbi:MAG: UvrD-helicase domain-containing protein [Anaerolineae bacterium]